jgi:hypothetical protein
MESKAEPRVVAKTGGAGRSRTGRRYVLALAISIAFIAVPAVWMQGVRSLNGLPDVGDPFDVTEARRMIVVPDSENAYVLYDQAMLNLTKRPAALGRANLKDLSWSKAEPSVCAYVEENRPALEIWRRGAERPDAIYHQPGEMTFDTQIRVAQELTMLGTWAGLEGSRLEEQGEMEEAWSWYRAMLRASRHVGRHGVLIERIMGAANHDVAARRIIRWAADPRVGAPLLRRALSETLAADAMTAPISETMKVEYLICMRDFDEVRYLAGEIPMPGGQNGWLELAAVKSGAKLPLQRIRLQATNDVERSRRVLRLLFANWLPQMDKPPDERVRVAVKTPAVVYAADPSAPASARAIAPEDLAAAVGHTLLAQHYFQPADAYWRSQGGAPWSGWAWEGNGNLAREPRQRAVLIVKLAAELYRREHGGLPANAGGLVKGYLKELPVGIKRDEPIPAGID